MVVHLSDGICYSCSGPDFPLPAWCKAECEAHRQKQRDTSPVRKVVEETPLDKFKKQAGIHGSEPDTVVLEAAMDNLWAKQATGDLEADSMKLIRQYDNVKVKCFHCPKQFCVGPDFIYWLKRGRCVSCYRWTCNKHRLQMFGRAIRHATGKYTDSLEEGDVLWKETGHGKLHCNACIAAGKSPKELFERTLHCAPN